MDAPPIPIRVVRLEHDARPCCIPGACIVGTEVKSVALDQITDVQVCASWRVSA
jgi:hypothetical protein